MKTKFPISLILLFILVQFLSVMATAADKPTSAWVDTSNWTANDDHANMMQQLGIVKLRKWKDGRTDAPLADQPNYDEALATPFPDLPELLVLNNGEPVTTQDQWWTLRRPEIVSMLENEVYGKIPDNVPGVSWKVEKETTHGEVGGIPVIAQRLLGKVDNRRDSNIEVNIAASLVIPADARGPVPVLVMFAWRDGPIPGEETGEAKRNPFLRADIPPSEDQLIAAGWGYVKLIPTSYQADSGDGLTKGIIGLTNCGQPRKPDDWGALRAWAWGAARILDYLDTVPEVDTSRVGIEGVSRYGKATLVTMAFEQRFSIALVASSGKGGVGLYRRNFGEDIGNLISSGQYHWMAGNFMKYGALESSFGKKTADDLPLDSHFAIALCAPRPTFISYGIPEKGDALWLDQQGSYMATVAAQPGFELLGVRGMGITEDYRTAELPPYNTDLLNGQLAWRQHDGGHESQSNMSHFIRWANQQLGCKKH